jgi:CheY-like chemotaxis protein
VQRRVNSTPVGSEKILVVEDDELVRTQVMVLLASLGYDVTGATNGAEALETLKSIGDFDLLFTDVVMPGGINGPQLADRAHKLYPGLAVLFTSGYTDTAIVQDGSPNSNVHMLNKPYRRQELAAKIRTVLGR